MLVKKFIIWSPWHQLGKSILRTKLTECEEVLWGNLFMLNFLITFKFPY